MLIAPFAIVEIGSPPQWAGEYRFGAAPRAPLPFLCRRRQIENTGAVGRQQNGSVRRDLTIRGRHPARAFLVSARPVGDDSQVLL